jgi:DNA transformation protein and related proteins
MKHDAAFSDHVLDLLHPLGGVTRKYMFGGWGYYKDGLFFALIADGRLYFKTTPSTVQAFLDAGLEQWTYCTEKGSMKMSYHAAPEAALESPPLMLAWARRGLTAAKEAAAAKKKPAPKSTKPKPRSRKD